MNKKAGGRLHFFFIINFNAAVAPKKKPLPWFLLFILLLVIIWVLLTTVYCCNRGKTSSTRSDVARSLLKNTFSIIRLAAKASSMQKESWSLFTSKDRCASVLLWCGDGEFRFIRL